MCVCKQRNNTAPVVDGANIFFKFILLKTDPNLSATETCNQSFTFQKLTLWKRCRGIT